MIHNGFGRKCPWGFRRIPIQKMIKGEKSQFFVFLFSICS